MYLKVTQRQQQQQLQQHKIVSQSHLQTISSSGEASNIHILPQTADLSKQIVQLTQTGLQVIQAQQPADQKPQIIQLTQGTQQQLLQVNATSDKPQLVQISHPGGQQQLIQINAGQQQLLQICQQPSQTPSQPIIQMCPIKQEQSVQTPETIQAQPVLLSQTGPGQPQQMIQLTPQMLPHLSQSVQQQILQATQVTPTRPVLSQQLLQDQGTPNVVAASDAGQQIAIVPQAMKQVQCHTVGMQINQSNQGPTMSAPKSEQVVQSSTVSVITSTASANLKPFVSRINGMRSFTPVNVIVVSMALIFCSQCDSGVVKSKFGKVVWFFGQNVFGFLKCDLWLLSGHN